MDAVVKIVLKSEKAPDFGLGKGVLIQAVATLDEKQHVAVGQLNDVVQKLTNMAVGWVAESPNAPGTGQVYDIWPQSAEDQEDQEEGGAA